ncbi:MAG: beta-ketoacyl-[acyl-carrier-protein] synthase family protein [Pirellulales bacterium]
MPLSTDRRVVITGMGLVSPIGDTPEALWDALVAGRSGVGKLSCVGAAGLPVDAGAEATGFTGDAENYGPLDKELKKNVRKSQKVMCREIQMGVAAAQKALYHSGIIPGPKFTPERTGCVFGSDYMLTDPREFESGVAACRTPADPFDFHLWASEAFPKLYPLWLLKYLPNMPAAHVSIFNDLRGPNNSLTQREASGNLAVGEAFRTIARGHADVMLAGSTGTRVHTMKSLHAVQTEELASGGDDPATLSRPFDRDRKGMVMGEGAGALVLEELGHAQRGATIYGELLGHASSTVADRNLVADRAAALELTIVHALKDACVSPAELGHIHAHGLATRSCDVDEATAIGRAFGAAATKIPVVAAKSNFGNLGAGSGVVELIASVEALRHGTLFPILNYNTPDAECPIRG